MKKRKLELAHIYGDDSSCSVILKPVRPGNRIKFPENPKFCPLGRIWARIREELRFLGDDDIVGIFLYEKDCIKANFYLNFAKAKDKSAKKHLKKDFEMSFPVKYCAFHNALEAFLNEKFDEYETFVKEKQFKKAKKIVDEFIESHLHSNNLIPNK